MWVNVRAFSPAAVKNAFFFLLDPTIECLSFTVPNDVFAEFDIRLFSHSSAESVNVLRSLKIKFSVRPMSLGTILCPSLTLQ